MFRFSVIVLTHGVPGRLGDCLDSVLDQSFTDIELIAVTSEDDELSASVAGDRAAEDPRVRVLNSPASHGLPAARNAGITAATGEFLLFLDGDDMFASDALRAIDARLTETGDPDLLLFDHARVHWFRGSQGPALRRLWQDAPEGTFTVQQHPGLPDPLVPAWSGAYRREFVRSRELAFPPGMFTDTAWSVLAALEAERIAVLDQVCVRHLLRRQGARNRAPGPHHTDLLDQFDRVMGRAATLELPGRLRNLIFERLTHAVLKTAATPRLLPSAALRRGYFRRASQLYRRHRPAGAKRPRGRMGVQHLLLEHGLYGVFTALCRSKSVAGSGRSQVRRAARRWGRGRPSAYRRYLAQPVDEQLAVFSAYWGRGYTCNPAAIHAKARELAPHIRCVFLVSAQHLDSVPEGVECVVNGSDAYWQTLARAKYAFNNVNFEGRMHKRPGTVHVQTQHGTPLKYMGVDQVDYPAAASQIGSFGKLLQRTDRWDFNLSANPHSTQMWERAFPCEFEHLEYGYPRNDVYYTATAQDVLRIRAALGIGEDRVALLYAPTHRDYQSGFCAQFDLADFVGQLDDSYVLLLRAHHAYDGVPGLESALASGRLIDVSGHPSTEELCLAADALVTDYSSIMFDYANLDRPIVAYLDDWEVYRESRGVYFDLTEHPPGAVARTEEELVEVFRSDAWRDATSRRLRAAFRERFCTFDDGHAAERVVRRVLLGQPPEAIPPPVPLHERTPAPAAADVLTQQ